MKRHLHFTQSLDSIRGGGLASSMLSMHSSMLQNNIPSSAVSTYSQQSFVGSAPPPGVLRYKESFQSPFFVSLDLLRDRGLLSASDFYHSHGLHTFVQYVFSKPRLHANAKLIIHPHGFLEPYIIQRARFKKNLVRMLFESSNFKRASLWRALTNKEASQIKKYFPWANVCILPNGVSIPPVFRAGSSQAKRQAESRFKLALQNKSVILYLSRLHPKKGLTVLLDAVSTLSTCRSDFHVIIAGSGSDEYKKKLMRIVSENSLSSFVSFIGNVSGNDKTLVFGCADIFVLPSLSEGLPMALLESCAHAVPVIYTPGCNLNCLSDQSAGLLCDHTPVSLISSLITLLDSSPSELAKRGSSLRSFVSTQFSWDKIVRSLHSYSEQLSD